MKKGRKLLLSVLAMICASVIGYTAQAADYQYVVECENSTDHNFTSTGGTITEDANLSGGKYIALYTQKDPAKGYYYLDNKVTVETGGIYNLFIATAPVNKGGWTSDMYLSVNGGEEVLMSPEKIADTSNSRIKWYSVGGVTLNAGENSIKFIVKEKLSSGYYVAFADCIALNVGEFKLRAVSGADSAYNVFESNQDIKMTVQANSKALEDSSYEWTLKDVHSNTLSSGTVTIKKGNSLADIEFSGLPLGYYDLTVGDITTGFSIVKPLSERKRFNDTPFAIDAPTAGFAFDVDEYVKILAMSGVSWVRERSYPGENTKYSNGTYTFSSSRAKIAGEKLKNYGIKVSAIVDKMPSHLSTTAGQFIPDDLLGTYKFWKEYIKYHGNSITNWEVFNEVDNGGAVSGWDSPDLYAAVVKAAAIGVEDAGIEGVTISNQGAAFSADDRSEYAKILMRNGLFDYSAFDNIHTHKTATSPYDKYYEYAGKNSVKAQLDAQNLYSRRFPLWVTEAGINISTTAGVNFTLEQQLVQAKYLVTSAIEAVASGVDKHFFFIGTNYREGEKAWGMMSEDNYKPYMYASMSAQSAMTDMLGKGTYKGKINNLASEVFGYVFNNGSEDVIAVWTLGSTKSVSFSASGKVYDMFGNFVSEQSGTVTVSASAEPLYIKCTSFTGSLTNERDEQLMAVDNTLSDVKRVILVQKYSDIARGGSRTDGYMLADNDNSVTLEVTNLCEKTMSGRIRYKSENGWKCDKEYVDVVLEPMSKQEIEFTITPCPGATVDYLSFIGEFNGEETSPGTVKLVYSNDGILTLEAERDAISYTKNFSTYKTDAGDAGLGVVSTSKKTYEIEFEFDVKSAGAYDLWALASVLNYTWSSNYNIDINGKRVMPSAKNSADIKYWSSHHAVGWSSFDDVYLNEGKNTVRFYASDVRGNGDSYIVSSLDKLMFIPKTHKGWREAEDFSKKKGLFYSDKQSASNGYSMTLFTYYIPEPITDNELDYNFAVDEQGGYDIWVLAARANVNWLTNWKIGVDATPSYASPISSTYAGYSIRGQGMYWHCIKQNATLKRGIHNIKIRGDEKRAEDNKYMLFIADAVAVVPAGTWTPSGNLDSDKITIAKNELLKEYDLDNIKKDIDLITETDNGVKISWTTYNSSVITTDGKVTRPSYGSGNKKVLLTAKLSYGSKSTTEYYYVTVLEAPQNDFTASFVMYDGFDAVTEEKADYAKVRAELKNNTGEVEAVKVYSAYYDEQTKELKDVAVTTVQLESESTESIEFAKKDGCDLCVYLWDDEMKPYGVAWKE